MEITEGTEFRQSNSNYKNPEKIKHCVYLNDSKKDSMTGVQWGGENNRELQEVGAAARILIQMYEK